MLIYGMLQLFGISIYTAMPQSITMFCPVIDLLSTRVLTCSATSSGVASDFSADLSVVAFTFDSGNFLPLDS